MCRGVAALPDQLSAADFCRFFSELSNGKQPHHWQSEISALSACENRLIRIPTGFGKTFGVFAAWAWHRVHMRDEDWPRRLVWCLPMRVLVEQTELEIRSALKRLGLLWDRESSRDNKVSVHLIMGGTDAGQWHLYPECNAVLIGTQDMLLSRAMNRGYASPRARWPMEFGLLNQDALWVMDEVQLMDAGLATSRQLQVFRDEDRGENKMLRPCFTWWMSATLQRSWLEKGPETENSSSDLEPNTVKVAPEDQTNYLWNDVKKHLEITRCKNTKELARKISQRHMNSDGASGLTLVVLNTVRRAVEVWGILRSDKKLKSTDIRLIHSRFRSPDRKSWHDSFLNRSACIPGVNRIIIATQVIEAGVDISASLLITELAPWTSLVQRFGRCARWGGKGQLIVVDFFPNSDREAAPYSQDEIDASRDACQKLPDADAGPRNLERFEKDNETLLPRLYPYNPTHVLLRHELKELFDTTADLSGADIDVSRFIRLGDERDVQVFWNEVDDDRPSQNVKPTQDEFCKVPFLEVRKWLCQPDSNKLKPGIQAWVWDWLSHEWHGVDRRDIYPGRTVLVNSNVGGYCQDQGWNPESKNKVAPIQSNKQQRYTSYRCWKRDSDGWHLSEKQVRGLPAEDFADDTEDDESLSITAGWQTIATHGLQVGEEVERIAANLAPSKAKLLHLAGRWHDLGKAHAAFQRSIWADNRPKRDDIAKAPADAWPCSTNNLYVIDASDRRPGFRHELASALGLFGVLQRHDPWHQALRGPWKMWFEKGWLDATSCEDDNFSEKAKIVEPTAIEQEVIDLSPEEFDLLAYLVCAHHGKVRVTWHASPADQKAESSLLCIRGVQEGDILPSLNLAAPDGSFHRLPTTELGLSLSQIGLSPQTGRSWVERVLNLVEHIGPFTLAWLETLLRVADQRASMKSTSDKLLQEYESDDA